MAVTLPRGRVPEKVAFMAHSLGAPDGISAASLVWQNAFVSIGSRVTTIAGQGKADHLLVGLSPHSDDPLDEVALARLLDDHDLVVVENCCSARLVPAASDAIARLLAGRPAILRHHDLAWQLAGSRDNLTPPDDPAWSHVTINERSRLELGARGLTARTIYHHFDAEAPAGDREAARAELGIQPDERLLLQPTRATASKNIAGGLVLAAALGALYWLLGPVDGTYRDLFDRLAARSPAPVVEGTPEGVGLADAYAACDAVVLPSTWEGFGNAALESAVYRRPFAIGPYPVGTELRRYGFAWFDWHLAAPLDRYLADPDPAVLERNRYVAGLRFSSDVLGEELLGVLAAR